MLNEKKISLWIVFSTFLLLIIGGVHHHYNDGLQGCVDGPSCLDQLIPSFNAANFIKLAHRFLGFVVGLLNILLLISVKRNETYPKRLKDLCLFALVMVIVQGVFGAITVIYKLPVLISTSHLALSMIYFLLILNIWRKIVGHDQERISSSDRKVLQQNWDTNLLDGLKISLGLLYSQIIFGAYLSHAGQGASCGVGAHYALKCQDALTGKLTWWPSLSGAQLHMGHRIWAFFVVAFIFYSCFKFVKFMAAQNFLSRELKLKMSLLGTIPVVLAFIQVCSGVMAVALNLHTFINSMHLVFSIFLLTSLWLSIIFVKDIELQCFEEKLFTRLGDYFSLIKPRLTLLVLSTCLIGLLAAPKGMSFFKALEFLLYMVGVVGGACAFNCYMEREVDKTMERTNDRPLPTGRISPGSAFAFSMVLSFVGLLGLLIKFNFITFVLGLLALLLYLFAYTPLKTKSLLSLWTGAFSGALPPAIGWTAATGDLGSVAITMFLIMFIWQLPHFLAISLYHQKDYGNASILIYPNIYGEKVTKYLIIVLTGILVLSSLVPYWLGKNSADYRNASLILGFLFLGLSLGGLRKMKGELMRRWAKKYFWGSIVYLPLLFIFLLFFTAG